MQEGKRSRDIILGIGTNIFRRLCAGGGSFVGYLLSCRTTKVCILSYPFQYFLILICILVFFMTSIGDL
ncbi:hypothetical protein F0562_013372 [Nyssa sinensis]|uniref:Uncharacterized protein n=1 Tax=Nyssa sinensis TaxID=561372 RepID=A0A5J4ZMW2_9ASTE|nr:hypothetical protein F0562_013372 [Nyssa sinensis]